MRGTCAPTSIENDAPRSSAQCAIWRQCSSGRPSRAQMMRAAYGSANSATNSTDPRSEKPSTSSWASAPKRGRIASIARLRNAGTISRRIRAWSSPSRLSRVSAHQVEKRPAWMPFCAGQRALPWRNRRSRSSADDLGVAQHGPAPVGLDVPVRLAGGVHRGRRGVEGRVGEVEAPLTCRPAPSGRRGPRRARPRCRRGGSPGARRTARRGRWRPAPTRTPRGRPPPPRTGRSPGPCPSREPRT